MNISTWELYIIVLQNRQFWSCILDHIHWNNIWFLMQGFTYIGVHVYYAWNYWHTFSSHMQTIWILRLQKVCWNVGKSWYYLSLFPVSTTFILLWNNLCSTRGHTQILFNHVCKTISATIVWKVVWRPQDTLASFPVSCQLTYSHSSHHSDLIPGHRNKASC